MDILTALRAAEKGMDDDQLAALLGLDRREVFRRCRRLAFQGILIREEAPDGRILNKVDRGGSAGDGRLYFEDQISIPR
jgi:predicted transcriptional regulator